MTEPRAEYITATQPIGDMAEINLQLSEWERNFILRLRQAASAGVIVTVDPDARCWWVSGRMECNKEDRVKLPFRM